MHYVLYRLIDYFSANINSQCLFKIHIKFIFNIFKKKQMITFHLTYAVTLEGKSNICYTQYIYSLLKLIKQFFSLKGI